MREVEFRLGEWHCTYERLQAKQRSLQSDTTCEVDTMLINKKAIAAVLANTVFALSVMGATILDWHWLGHLVVGFVWFMLVIYAFAAFSTKRSEKSKVGFVAMWMLDVCIFGLFLFFHWYVTAAAYAVSCLLEGVATKVRKTTDIMDRSDGI